MLRPLKENMTTMIRVIEGTKTKQIELSNKIVQYHIIIYQRA